MECFKQTDTNKVNSDSQSKVSGSDSLNRSKMESACISENVTNVSSNSGNSVLSSAEKNLSSLPLGKNENFSDFLRCSVNVKICETCMGEGAKCVEKGNEKRFCDKETVLSKIVYAGTLKTDLDSTVTEVGAGAKGVPPTWEIWFRVQFRCVGCMGTRGVLVW